MKRGRGKPEPGNLLEGITVNTGKCLKIIIMKNLRERQAVQLFFKMRAGHADRRKHAGYTFSGR